MVMKQELNEERVGLGGGEVISVWTQQVHEAPGWCGRPGGIDHASVVGMMSPPLDQLSPVRLVIGKVIYS